MRWPWARRSTLAKAERERDIARANLTEFALPAICETVAAYSEQKLARRQLESSQNK